MKESEARDVLGIMLWADGGCPYCAKNLFKSFIGRFGFKEIANEVYKKQFSGDLEDEE